MTIRQPTIIYDDPESFIPHDLTTGHFVLIRDGCTIGYNVSIGSFSEVEGCTIGNNVRIHSHCFIPRLTIIRDNVWIGPHVVFANDKYPTHQNCARQGVFVADGVIIGAGARILPGVTIGQNAIIGMGAVVVRDVPADCTVVGNPARIIKRAGFVVTQYRPHLTDNNGG